jgi:hypothetical protein
MEMRTEFWPPCLDCCRHRQKHLQRRLGRSSALAPAEDFHRLTEEDSVERWFEHFEERAMLAGWNREQRVHQLTLLLERTALKAFPVLPEADRENYDKAKTALNNWFKSVDIAELRGLEFHHMQ